MSFGTLFVNCCCQVKIGLNHYFVLFSIFFCSDDHIFLFTRSHYIPILIVYHLIQFSKEENWFYKRFQLTFQTLRPKRSQLFLFVRLPLAIPYALSGVRVAASVAPIGAVVGEWVGSSQGLGYLMLLANGRVKTDLMFAALFTLGVLSMSLYGFITLLIKLAFRRFEA